MIPSKSNERFSMKRTLYLIAWLLYGVGLLLHVPFEGMPKFASREVAWLVQASGVVLLVALLVTRVFLDSRRKK
jgi:fucose permease